ncbi:MAG: NUDIX pyrophosphatase [Candidatus Wallbacteria bacterium HGW-Wallbacteria-1]|uniref:NUDIX pyrophosphatase n=1 Tax=Candidatus Wallbacteria bacterium HGW-Wallbacteria-1 TaxID=2013854 RepID=A0A2N1PM65_9BACT|nr:MAG: NUDIX pyrophosphatase [Candidatus Wallbacteria bacterium HGW-Wallbacteria-1]
MSRAPFQVLIIPYIVTDTAIEYAVFRRSDTGVIQFLAGGGERGEIPLQAAVREALEEAGINNQSTFLELQSKASIPVSCFTDRAHWPNDMYVVPEHSFGVQVTEPSFKLSREHLSFEWCSYITAFNKLTYSGNRTALWELHCRLRGIAPRQTV